MSNVSIPNLPLPPVIDYTSRDYSSILNDAINLIPNYLPAWTDRSTGDFGIALLELWAYMADIQNYYVDRIANEAFLATAVQYQSILNIASLLDYTPSGNVAATALVQFTIANPSPSPVTVPEGSIVSTNPQQGTSIEYQTLAPLTIWGDNTSPTTVSYTATNAANQQVLLTGPFDGSTVTVSFQNMLVTKINGGTVAVNSGTNITSVMLESNPASVGTGDTLVLNNETGNTMNLTVTGGPYAASTSNVTINVTSIAANATYTPNVAVAKDNSWVFNWVKAPSNTFTGVSSTATDFIVVNGNTIEFGNGVNGLIPYPGSIFSIVYYPFNGSQYSASVEVMQATSVTGEIIGLSNGNPGQTFTLFQNPVINASVQIQVMVGESIQTWTYFGRLVDAGPTDLAFTTATNANGVVQILFGDGINGVIPPPGATLSANYQVGGGSAGNVASNTIVNFSGVSGVISVTNPSPATGGADAESIEHIRTHAPLSLTALNRAVTLSDYAALAQNNPSVAKSAAVAGNTPTLVTLYIHPPGGFFTSATQLSSQVAAVALQLTNAAGNGYLDTRKIANVSVAVSPPAYNNGLGTTPGYVPVNVSVTVQVLPNYTQSSVLAAVQSAIANLFSFVNVDFGVRISLSSVYQALQGITGVAYAQVTNLARLELSPSVGDIVCATYEIPQLNLPNQPVVTINGGITA